MNKRHTLALLLIALCLLPAVASADPPFDPPGESWRVAANDDWSTLSEQEQQLLRQHRQRWSSYTPEQKAHLRKGVQRYQNLSPDERQGVERERERYETMSPQERQRLREKYDRSRDR